MSTRESGVSMCCGKFIDREVVSDGNASEKKLLMLGEKFQLVVKLAYAVLKQTAVM